MNSNSEGNNRTWILEIFLSELNIHQNIRVSNSTVVHTVFKDLINKVNLKCDWTEFWFWCPSQSIWLLPKSSTLSQFNIQSHSKVDFVRRFNVINIQLPDLQIRQILLDFSKTVWKTNEIICKKFGIRHHEELSLQCKIKNKMKPFGSNHYQKSKSVSQQSISRSNLTLRSLSQIRNNKPKPRLTFYFNSNSSSQAEVSLKLPTPSPAPLISQTSFFSIFDNSSQTENDSLYFESFENKKFSNSSLVPFSEAFKQNDIILFKTYKEKSTLNFKWMVSEQTLMEQIVEDYSNILLLLRYKYHSYYYFNEQFDDIRINQIFHQAYWSVVTGETDCDAEDAYILGGILYQINKSKEQEKVKHYQKVEKNLDTEINSMLDNLQLELIGDCEENEERGVLDISGQIYLIKYPKSFYSRYKKYSAFLKTSGIHFCKGSGITKLGYKSIPIKGNEIKINIKMANEKYFILDIILLKNNLHKMSDVGMIKDVVDKYRLKFMDKEVYLKWATALRLLSKSIDFSLSSNFKYEHHLVSNIIEMKEMQEKSKSIKINVEDENINLTDYIGPKFNKSFKRKEILEKIVYFGKAFNHYNTIQAKIAYIKCWITFTNAGMRYFQVKINKKKELELIGIGYNRIVISDIDLGTVKQCFEMTKVIRFDTNWELFFNILQFETETLRIEFFDLSDCQMFHEYIGGYLFIMMRNSEKYSNLSEDMFRSLTSRHVSKM